MISSAIVIAIIVQAQAPGPAPRDAVAAAALASTPAPTLVAKPKAARGSEMVCHPGAGTGRILGPPMCHTQDQWDVMARNATAGVNRGPGRSCRPGMMQDC